MTIDSKDKKTKPLSKGMAVFRASLGNIMEHKLEEMEEKAMAKAIKQMMNEEEEQEQNLQ